MPFSSLLPAQRYYYATPRRATPIDGCRYAATLLLFTHTRMKTHMPPDAAWLLFDVYTPLLLRRHLIRAMTVACLL